MFTTREGLCIYTDPYKITYDCSNWFMGLIVFMFGLIISAMPLGATVGGLSSYSAFREKAKIIGYGFILTIISAGLLVYGAGLVYVGWHIFTPSYDYSHSNPVYIFNLNRELFEVFREPGMYRTNPVGDAMEALFMMIFGAGMCLAGISFLFKLGIDTYAYIIGVDPKKLWKDMELSCD